MECKALESINFVGWVHLLEAAKLVSKRLGMKFKEEKNTDKGIEYEVVKITGKNEEYEIRKNEEHEGGLDASGFYNASGYYNNNYVLWKLWKMHGNVECIVLESRDYASWNKFDETTSVERYTNLYLEDKLGREILRILKENGR